MTMAASAASIVGDLRSNLRTFTVVKACARYLLRRHRAYRGWRDIDRRFPERVDMSRVADNVT
jgi:hypothetical protein